MDGGPAVKVASGLEALVRSGRVPPEALLPPVRELAAGLGISPGTAASAYRLLAQRGVVRADGRRGTRVLAPPARREWVDAEAPAGALDLRSASPDPALLPDLKRLLTGLDPAPGGYDGDHLLPELRRRSRAAFEEDGVEGGELMATAGAIPAIHGALRANLAPGDRVAVEDPGFNEHHACVEALGLEPVPVAVDDEGVRAEALTGALRAGARAVILTVRCQSPTGAALSPARAAAVRKVLAAHADVAVLVDDYLSLLSPAPYEDVIGRRERWLVVRSFTKPVAPEVRVGVAAGDAATLERMRREQWLSAGWISSYLQQLALAAMADRAAAAAVARARKVYVERREALLAALRARGIEAHGRSGLVVWVPVPDEAEVVAGLAARGLCVRAGARYRLEASPAVRVAIGALPVSEAPRVADAIQAVLRSRAGARAP
ncbi:MAG: aminotransferase class I/II-fold pyridoxal phosphate-dependent enzyme [Anaeromyxobacter sp.]